MLSKSKFTRGINCPKSLWLYVHKKEEQCFDDGAMAIFALGTNTGELARGFFPGGTLAVAEDELPGYDSAQRTQELIAAGVETIYEATYIYDKTLVAVDILTKIDDQWQLFEMKSTNSVKPQHYKDVAVQYYVVTGSGIPLADASVMHMNRDYVRIGQLDVKQLFIHESVLEVVASLQDYVKDHIQELLAVESSEEEPIREMGGQCDIPYHCDFYDYCSKLVASPLTRHPSLVTLAPSQKTDPSPVTRQSSPNITPGPIRTFLKSIPYPHYYLDFETIMPCVPMFDYSRPYQQLAFQYSLHYKASRGADCEHSEYLAGHKEDPRIGLIRSLIENTRRPGPIIVYNIGFERSRLSEMQRDFPRYATELGHIIKRLVDLMPVFRSKHYVSESMGGSYSIKSVLPALCPDCTYDELEIQDGGSASGIFLGLYGCEDAELIEKTRQDLLAYCKMDTWGMVRVVEVLESCV